MTKPKVFNEQIQTQLKSSFGDLLQELKKKMENRQPVEKEEKENWERNL